MYLVFPFVSLITHFFAQGSSRPLFLVLVCLFVFVDFNKFIYF